ncbi:hypothetical protein BHE74_00051066, partial [Ensete ventricosum]
MRNPEGKKKKTKKKKRKEAKKKRYLESPSPPAHRHRPHCPRVVATRESPASARGEMIGV